MSPFESHIEDPLKKGYSICGKPIEKGEHVFESIYEAYKYVKKGKCTKPCVECVSELTTVLMGDDLLKDWIKENSK